MSPFKSTHWSDKKQSSKNFPFTSHLSYPTLRPKPHFLQCYLWDPNQRTHFRALLLRWRIPAAASITFPCCLQGLKTIVSFLLILNASRPRVQFPFLIYLPRYALPMSLWKYHQLLTTVHLNPLSPSLQLPGCSKGWTYFVCVAQMHKQFQSETLGLSEFLHYGFILLLQVWQHSLCLQPSCHVLTEAINLITENLLTVLHFFQPYSGSASLTQAQ